MLRTLRKHKPRWAKCKPLHAFASGVHRNTHQRQVSPVAEFKPRRVVVRWCPQRAAPPHHHQHDRPAFIRHTNMVQRCVSTHVPSSTESSVPVSPGVDSGSRHTAALSIRHTAALSIMRGHKAQPKYGTRAQPTPLLEAVMAGDLQGVIRECADVGLIDAFNKEGDTPLCLAANRGSLDIVQHLLQHGALVHHRNNLGRTPLMEAASRGHVDVFTLLMEHGAKMEDTDNLGNSAFLLAAQRGHTDMLHFMLQRSSDSNSGGSTGDGAVDVSRRNQRGRSAFMLACSYGHLETAKFLRDQFVGQFSADDEDNNNSTVLKNAAFGGSLPVVRYLVEECNADVFKLNRYGSSTLDAAFVGGNLEVAQYLHERGATLTVFADNTTALHHVAFGGNADLAVFLLRKVIMSYERSKRREFSMGRPSGEKSPFGPGATPLHIATMRGKHDALRELLRFSLPKDIRAKHPKYGGTLLHLAAHQGHAECVKLLYTSTGLLANLTDHRSEVLGETPLHAACCAGEYHAGHVDVVRYLLSQGADLNLGNRQTGDVAVGLACREGNLSVVRELLRAKADASRQNHAGQFALYSAALLGDLPLAQLIMEESDPQVPVNQQCDPKNPMDRSNGETPLHAACRQKHLDLVRYLVEHGADPNIKNKWGENALYPAVIAGGEAIVQYLLEQTLSPVVGINEVTGHHRTTLAHTAAQCGHVGILRTLCAKGADPQAIALHANTPLHLAAMMGHISCVRFLVEQMGCDMWLRNKRGQKPVDWVMIRKASSEKNKEQEYTGGPDQDKSRSTKGSMSQKQKLARVAEYLLKKMEDTKSKYRKPHLHAAVPNAF